MRFSPTVTHDCNPSDRAGQAIHGCAAYSQCFKNFDSINHFFLIGHILGQNMAWLDKKINA